MRPKLLSAFLRAVLELIEDRILDPAHRGADFRVEAFDRFPGGGSGIVDQVSSFARVLREALHGERLVPVPAEDRLQTGVVTKALGRHAPEACRSRTKEDEPLG